MIFSRTMSILLRSRKIFLVRQSFNKLLIHMTKAHSIHQNYLIFYGKYSTEYPRNDLEEMLQNVEQDDIIIQSKYNKLTTNNTDNMCERIVNSTSIEELLNLVEMNQKDMTWLDLTEALSCLCELQKSYFTMHGLHFSTPKQSFVTFPEEIRSSINALIRSKNFELLLLAFESNFKFMDILTLADNLFNLIKLGVSIKEKLPQMMVKEFQLRFANGNHNLEATSLVINALFFEKDLYSYYMIKEFVPVIYSSIGSCKTTKDIQTTTDCLMNIKYIIPDDILQKYRDKVNNLIDNKILCSKDYKTIIKIISFLNYHQFRSKNIELMAKSINVMESNIHYLSISDLLYLFEVFLNIFEPAGVLNELQRHANLHLQKLEEEGCMFYDTQIQLLIGLSCFSSPKRLQLNSLLHRYIDCPLSYKALQEYYKLIIISKCNDLEICKTFWDKYLSYGNQSDKNNYIFTFENYMNFHRKLYNFRYKKVEAKLNEIIEKTIQDGIDVLIPWKCALLASYVLAFSNNEAHIEYFLYKIKENLKQFSNMDCFNLSKALEIGFRTKPNQHVMLLSVIKDVEKYVSETNFKLERANLLIHCYGWSSSFDKMMDEQVIKASTNNLILSSQTILNVAQVLEKTNIYLPNVIEQICDYVLIKKYDLIGFVAEKAITMCYNFGHVPAKLELMDIVTDLLIRNERRLSSLSYIESALALSFFQALPDAIVKQIFNVEFLENIDNELTICYYKDTYPFRVRYALMQLNRAVCLDYPEKNVPWFHQNFIDYMKKYNKPSHTKLHAHLWQILKTLLKDNGDLKENIYTPYGYHIDFVFNQEKNRIALILLPHSAFTKHRVQLKGEYLLKIRHLEILGYKVLYVNSLVLQKMDLNEQIKYFENIVQ